MLLCYSKYVQALYVNISIFRLRYLLANCPCLYINEVHEYDSSNLNGLKRCLRFDSGFL